MNEVVLELWVVSGQFSAAFIEMLQQRPTLARSKQQIDDSDLIQGHSRTITGLNSLQVISNSIRKCLDIIPFQHSVFMFINCSNWA